jgi:hypothetical protein
VSPMTPAAQADLRAGDKMADIERYQSRVGSLLHLAQCVRPDIVAPVGVLVAFNSAPTNVHLTAMLDVFRYIGSTAELGITEGQSIVSVAIWCDANLVGCLDTRRSQSGWVVVCFVGAVSRESCKQPSTAVSTMDAEYQACEPLSLPLHMHSFRHVGCFPHIKLETGGDLIINGILLLRGASQVPLELSEEAGHGCMVLLSLLVLPLPMLHAGCNTLLTHQLQVWAPGYLCHNTCDDILFSFQRPPLSPPLVTGLTRDPGLRDTFSPPLSACGGFRADYLRESPEECFESTSILNAVLSEA